MNPIPQVEFRNRPSELQGIEVLDLHQLFERNMPTDHDPYQHHRPNFFIVLLITDGQVLHTVDFKQHQLRAGDCLVISKGQSHAFDPSSSYHGIMTIFTESYLLKYCPPSAIDRITILYNYFLSPARYKVPDLVDKFSSEFVNEYKVQDLAVRNHILGGLLTMFLIKLQASSTIEPPTANGQYLKHFMAFKRLLERHYTATRDAKAFAEMLGLSYRLLNKVCKEVQQKTAKAFIDDFVTLEIKRQLVSTSLSTKQITYACGFDEPANFVKFFKKHTGLTPTAFRASLQPVQL